MSIAQEQNGLPISACTRPPQKARRHSVQVVYHPETALQAARSQIPDIVLIDIGLPSMDGCELAGRLRAIAEGKPMVVIAITGYGVLRNNSITGGLTDLYLTMASSSRDHRCPYSLPVLGGPTVLACAVDQAETLARSRESLPAPSAGILQREGHQAATHRCRDSDEVWSSSPGCLNGVTRLWSCGLRR
jgi:CheY-like chemotaxis protein